jgi:UDP-N-acetyl-D-mannosaminuronic acid transferase (WecB/TagA/CpsF family)
VRIDTHREGERNEKEKERGEREREGKRKARERGRGADLWRHLCEHAGARELEGFAHGQERLVVLTLLHIRRHLSTERIAIVTSSSSSSSWPS